ncbi:MAG TPA: hypothetical protein VJU61_14585 [Polyangiaceae bacterium]|nr:hypothetical protein [Polyangiaceae bacterium]
MSALVCGALAAGCGKDEAGGDVGSAGSGGSGQAGSGSTGIAGSSGSGGSSSSGDASIEMRIAAPAASSGGLNQLLAFAGGGAVRPGLESLEYYIYSVQICESLEASGSGFANPTGCLELYSGDRSLYNYEIPSGALLVPDWTSLAADARGSDVGFVDLIDPSARAALGGTTPLTGEHVRSYHYGIITWSLPVKVKASVALSDGSFLYTHDGSTTYQTIGADNYRDYYTSPSIGLNVGPAEKAVVILGNGGNWFKFQNPLQITQADIDEKRQWVLDLVFNPEGIVKGFSGEGTTRSNIREVSEAGASLRGISVPMLDLAPVPHRASEQVIRESYLASLSVGPDTFDARIELYSVEGDPNQSVYGVDVKSLVSARGTSVPPDLAKISSITHETDGSLSFRSYTGAAIISGFHRVAEEFGTTSARLVCAQHENRAGAEGGAAMVVNTCPSANIDATFTLVGRRRLDGDIPLGLPVSDAGADAAATDAGVIATDAGDAGG